VAASDVALPLTTPAPMDVAPAGSSSLLFACPTAVIRPAPIVTPPDTHEMQARTQRLRGQMDAAGLDAYVLVDPDNVFYLTNFANYVHERPFVLVPVGYPAPGATVPDISKKPLDEIRLFV